MMRNYYRNLLEGYTCIKMKSLSIEQACKLTQPVTYSSKILKIQSTNHKSNWTSGGGTYQGAISPKISSKDGLGKEIKNREQEQQELELEKVFRCFSGERKKMAGKMHLGGPQVGHTLARWVPLGHSRCPYAPFFEEKFILNF